MTDTEMEEFWRQKTDEELSPAGSRLIGFTEDGQRVVCDELERRGMPIPEQMPEGTVAEEIIGRLWLVSVLANRYVLLPIWAARRVREINLAASQSSGKLMLA